MLLLEDKTCQEKDILKDLDLDDLALEDLNEITEFPEVAFVCNCVDPKFFVVEGYLYPILVPCGKCELCRLRTRREWSLRLALESFQYGFNSEFVTLTYNEENLPKSGDLCLRDYQLFLKRLRKISPPLRYFVAGEYGSKFGRPHYHLLIFGDYDPQKVEDSWDLGFVKVKPICIENINYCSAYVQKKLDNVVTPHVIQEFARMSLRPGIGYNWCVSHADLIMELGKINFRGRSYPVPRYFRKILYDLYPAWKDQRMVEYNEKMKDFFSLPSGFPNYNYPYFKPNFLQQILLNNSKSEALQRCIDLKKKRELYKIKHCMQLEAL